MFFRKNEGALVQKNSVIRPLPTEKDILEREDYFEEKLPKSYRDFLMTCGGGVPVEAKQCFSCEGDGTERLIERYLTICPDYADHPLGDYDISVLLTYVEDRLLDDPESTGYNVIPIAALFAGDLLCLDFRKNAETPTVCVWDHEESEEDAPVFYHVADSFEQFCTMLSAGE